jgi:uncharacterized membrane protein YagU involved in acid resistance
MRSWMEDALAGAAAGVLGTGAMTVLMEPGLAGRLPRRYRPSEFVPRQIVEWAEARAGRPDALSERGERRAAALAHLGYGAAMGAAYALLRRRWDALPAAGAGAAWGALVWAFGYEGWMPAAGVRPATTDHPPEQWPLPVANHLVYGVTTALAFERMVARR